MSSVTDASPPPAGQSTAGASYRIQASIFLVGLGHGATHWLLGTFLILLPFVTKELGLSYTEAGLMVTVLHLSSFFTNISGGMVVDISGRRVVFLVICLLAGASGMRPLTFFTLNLSGTLARLYAIRWLGDVFADPIESILGFIQDYRVPLLVLTVSLVGWTFLREWRSGSSEVASLAHLDEGLEEAHEDLEADAEELEPPAGGD